MYQLIINKFTEEWKSNVLVEKQKYKVKGNSNGKIIFKLLIKQSIIDTLSSSGKFMDNISSV